MLLTLLLGIFLTHVKPARAGNVYYVDYSSGQDTNPGTSKQAPWMHAPGMNGCSNICAAASPKAGDSVILKGGVTWPGAALQWNWTWGGSSAASIYIGVDQTWYSGSGWARPILNGGGTQVSGNNDFINLQGSPSYIQIDNIEFTGLYWSGTPSYGSAIYIEANGSTNIAITNSYFHGWSHGTLNGGTHDGGEAIQGDTGTPYNQGSYVADCVFDGTDTDGQSLQAIYMWPDVHMSIFRYMANGIVGRLTLVHDNLVEYISNSFDPATHSNGIENTGSNGLWMYNNLVRHITAAVAVFNSITPGGKDYYYNNVIFDTTVIPLQLDTDLGGTQNSTEYVYNNTLQGTGFLLRVEDRGNGPLGTGVARNNHFISDGTPVCYNNSQSGCAGITNPVSSNNITQTNAAAQQQGYTSSNDYSPTSSNDATVDAGKNLSNSCSGQLQLMCKATTLAVTETASYTVLSPARMPNNRPSGNSPWDSGAYEYAGYLDSPKGLAAVRK